MRTQRSQCAQSASDAGGPPRAERWAAERARTPTAPTCDGDRRRCARAPDAAQPGASAAAPLPPTAPLPAELAARGLEQAAEMIENVLRAQRQQQAAAAAASPPPASPASSSSSSSSSPIPIGTRVELHGLKAKPELNGQRGVVEGFDAASGRCKVKLEDGRGPFKLKVENLKRTAMTTTTKKKKKKKGGK